MKKIVIAIDGYSGTGKSSTAKQVASRLSYTYIDSGAMYRAVAWFFIQNKIDYSNNEELVKGLEQCHIEFQGKKLLLNNQPLDGELRTMEVNNHVSSVSTIEKVREKLVDQQREMGKEKGVVMDGRDIGTVVFPDAELKLFMTADMDIRAERRKKELDVKGINESLQKIKENLKERDRVDSSRKYSPLKQAEDAKEIDTSHLTLNQQIDKIVALAESIIYAG
ncbi:cytidylate kinase [Ekhidna lutea]|uniref:Cytidylate kinase n=1 Tax=Ekhidna lutea TaxID=447679 RepID=A0A239L3X7_EKHLU|nr:(d)CMP kinase [Ekhidna lutea]SNT24628.1 cytidylate kinase [Ekhidna lutea]